MTTEPTYRHIFNSDQCGRKGTRCEIVRGNGFLVQIRFEDGFMMVVNRQTVKRPKPGQMKRLDQKQESSSILSPSPALSEEQ